MSTTNATPSLQGIWTQTGLAKEVAFRAGGAQKVLTHAAVGTGGGSLPLVSPAQSGLVDEIWRGLVNSVMVNPDDPTDLLVDVVIPNNVGGFWIREWGLFDEDGDLIAVGPHDEMHKPLLDSGQAAEFLERFHLPSANATFVTLSIASQSLATQAYVRSQIATHNSSDGAHLKTAPLFSAAGTRSAPIAAGTDFTVPGYLPGSGKLAVYLDGVRCWSGTSAALASFVETGTAGALSTVIRWHQAIPITFDILVEVR